MAIFVPKIRETRAEFVARFILSRFALPFDAKFVLAHDNGDRLGQLPRNDFDGTLDLSRWRNPIKLAPRRAPQAADALRRVRARAKSRAASLLEITLSSSHAARAPRLISWSGVRRRQERPGEVTPPARSSGGGLLAGQHMQALVPIASDHTPAPSRLDRSVGDFRGLALAISDAGRIGASDLWRLQAVWTRREYVLDDGVPYSVDTNVGIVAASSVDLSPQDPLKEGRSSALAGWVLMTKPRFAELERVAERLQEIRSIKANG